MFTNNTSVTAVQAFNIRAKNIAAAQIPEVTQILLDFGEINDEQISDILDQKFDQIDLPSTSSLRALYAIEAPNQHLAQMLFHAFSSFKRENGRNAAVPKLNDEPLSTTLYVGSSQSIRRRLKEHIVGGDFRTYCLRIKDWVTEFEGQICLKVQLFSSEISPQCLQDIEIAVWNELKPRFGREGR